MAGIQRGLALEDCHHPSGVHVPQKAHNAGVLFGCGSEASRDKELKSLIIRLNPLPCKKDKISQHREIHTASLSMAVPRRTQLVSPGQARAPAGTEVLPAPTKLLCPQQSQFTLGQPTSSAQSTWARGRL